MKDGEKRKKRRKRAPQQLVKVPVLHKTVECPACSEAIDLWASDERARCTWCGYQVVTNCLQSH